MKTILLNGKELNFSKDDLPLIIHGEDGNGASHFSVSVIANFYLQGEKIIFTSGFQGARDSFSEQVGKNDDTILIESKADLKDAQSKRVIMVPAENHELYKLLLNDLPDIDERIIYFKNYDLFDISVFEEVCKHRECILQGDLNKITNLTSYKNVAWTTKIYFTMPPESFDSPIPDLPKYSGFLRRDSTDGTVSLVM